MARIIRAASATFNDRRCRTAHDDDGVLTICMQRRPLGRQEKGCRRHHSTRGVTINLRADHRRRALIDRAAATAGKNRSEFMLDAACREATSVLLDQRLFLVDEKAFKRFNEALEKAPADNPRLRRLLTTKAPWER